MRRYAAILGTLLLVGMVGLSQEKQDKEKKEPQKPAASAEYKIPPEEARRENPFKPTPASVTEGKRLYGFDCAMCHGKEGDGKGDLAVELKLELRDWRDPAALANLTDGELYYIMAKGKGRMPGDETRMKPEQRWNIINYLRSLSKKEKEQPAPHKL